MADPTYVVLEGNPVDGLRVFGPLREDELENLESHFSSNTEYWVVETRDLPRANTEKPKSLLDQVNDLLNDGYDPPGEDED